MMAFIVFIVFFAIPLIIYLIGSNNENNEKLKLIRIQDEELKLKNEIKKDLEDTIDERNQYVIQNKDIIFEFKNASLIENENVGLYHALVYNLLNDNIKSYSFTSDYSDFHNDGKMYNYWSYKMERMIDIKKMYIKYCESNKLAPIPSFKDLKVFEYDIKNKPSNFGKRFICKHPTNRMSFEVKYTIYKIDKIDNLYNIFVRCTK